MRKNDIRGGTREWSKNLWEHIKALFSGLDTRVTALEQGGGGGAVSGVKGDAESTYRTGNVNLTPANIGAKATQSAVSDPTASGTGLTFIDSISQDAQGVITPTKKTVQTATQSANGIMSSTDKAKLDGIAAGAEVNTITGVKGDAESSYRTGNVNLTPENVGAVDKTGDSMSGNLYVSKAGDTYVKVTNTNTNCGVYLNSGTMLHGIWSDGYWNGSSFVSDGLFMIYREASGTVHLNGMANNIKSGRIQKTFTNGKTTIAFSDIGLTARPSAMVIIGSSNGPYTAYDYDYAASSSNIVIYGADILNATRLSGTFTMSYIAVV